MRCVQETSGLEVMFSSMVFLTRHTEGLLRRKSRRLMVVGMKAAVVVAVVVTARVVVAVDVGISLLVPKLFI